MKRFKNIVYVNEPTVDQESMLARAVSLAGNNQADLTIIDVIPAQVATVGFGLPPGGPISNDLQAIVEFEHRKIMEAMVRPFKEHLQIHLEVLVGKTYLEAVRAVLKNGYDLLIKPVENPTWTNRLFGSDDLHLLRKCPCPVWLMKAPEKSNYRSIVAAVDFDLLNSHPSEENLNREILELAASLALSDFASLHIIHAWETIAEKTMLSRSGISPEGVATYFKNAQTRHSNELNQLAEKLQEWVGKEAYDYLSPNFHMPEGSAKKVIAPFYSAQ